MDFEKKVKVLKMLKDKGVSSSKQLSDLAGNMRKMIEMKLTDDCKLVVMDLVDSVSKNSSYFDTFVADSGEQGRALYQLRPWVTSLATQRS